jgi:hypothetical protein
MVPKLCLADALGLEWNAIPKAATDESNPAAQTLGGIDIANARFVFICIALAHGSEPGSEAIQVGA